MKNLCKSLALIALAAYAGAFTAATAWCGQSYNEQKADFSSMDFTVEGGKSLIEEDLAVDFGDLKVFPAITLESSIDAEEIEFTAELIEE